MKEYKRSCRLAHPSQDCSEMKYSVILLALVSVALGPQGIQSQSTLPRLGGVNTAGYDFTVYTNGSFLNQAEAPPTWEYAHFSAEGANFYRLPFAWQEMTPTLGGPINTTFLAQYQETVTAALNSSSNAHAIVDLHNYARWNGGIIAQGGPTNEEYASIWSQLSKVFGSNDRLLFGIMNEPHDLDIPTWAESVQYVVNAIRAAGATNYLLLPGSNYTSAQTFPTGAGPYLLNVTDPLGGTERLIFDVHKYLDYDNSGTHAECVTNNTEVLETLVSWLQANGNRQAVLSETGGGNTASCETYLYEELAYVKSAYPSLVGFSVWAAGAFPTTYILSVTPNANGTDQPLWIDAVRPNLPAP
ncbi:Manganese dependent endoglucanase Eg5A [Taiwanofungus camphoratus]|nr:Manganese dependent endoglucanase Eg5A [Antrodia cinnamomea]